MTVEPLLDIAGLRQLRGQRQVLRGVDLLVGRGEVMGLVGRNGSGKSSLVKAITGDLTPESGTMRLDGEPYRPRSRAEAGTAGVSVIEQNFTVTGDQTVMRAMYRNTFMAEWPDAELLERGREVLALARFDLELSTQLGDLDPAEQALAEVLRVLAEEAQLVIFDEVSVLLNDLEIARLHDACRGLRERGCSVVYIAHRLEEVVALCDRVAVLRDGVVTHVAVSGSTAVDELAVSMFGRPVRHLERRSRAAGDPVLVVRGLRVPDGGLHGVDLTVRAGEVVGVIGMRRSGAVELVEALGGRVGSELDAAEVDGDPIDGALGADARITYVAAPDHEILTRKVADLLTASQEYASEIERLREAIRGVEREDLTVSYIQEAAETLSGGDRQKLAVLSATSPPSRVVVLNHPTRSVDVAAKERTYDLVAALAAEGRGVVLLSIDVAELLRCCDRVVVLREGVVVADLHSAEVDEDVVMEYAIDGTCATTGVSRRRRVARAAGGGT
jgi:ribose transport system ATP-binding protein